jgi:hypothetical protein
MKENLRYLKGDAVASLKKSVSNNIDRYASGNFLDFAGSIDWNLESRISVDLSGLSRLQLGTGSDVEVANSLIVGEVLGGLPPAAATDDRLWTRLSHVECLEYSRARWLRGKEGSALEHQIRTHFFGGGLTAARDDHPIGRLWWNHRIALRTLPFLNGLSIERVLKVILSRADVRLNTVERSGIMSRPRLAAAIVRALLDDPELLGEEARFRGFMKAINAQGGGVPFEVPAISDAEVIRFVARCAAISTGTR